ncbi:hypothetical protein B0H15DRAFT_956072 [Mycena belliarum]|uniref:Uncharacterized protein n=1 Tax=Mycena belliarum TaxID=1033014 RepID=A0AAD6XJQ7_9AGAR|nr:hypothetical protein B0H15DRAFT_956072 [Mycena belliae]
MTSLAEIRRLFGPSIRPHADCNARHRALLRKTAELISQSRLDRIFDKTNNLRCVMGGKYNSTQFGVIQQNYVRNLRLITNQTEPLDPEALRAFEAYRDALDGHYMKNGHHYTIRGAGNLSGLQGAEQTWHDFAVPYLARQGRTRPDWALEPLPGLQRVRVGPPLPPPARTPAARLPAVAAVALRPFPTLATPPPSSSSPTPAPGRRLRRICIPAPPPVASGSRLRRHSTPAPPVASGSRLPPLMAEAQTERRPLKRKFNFLDEIDISSDDDDEPAQKRSRIFIDLTGDD